MAAGRAVSLFLAFAFFFGISVPQIVAEPQIQGEITRGTDTSGKANYTVSFVPLISVIANWFPRLLTRFNPQVQQARGHVGALGMDGSVTEEACQQFTPYGLRWPDPRNSQQFLYCYSDPVCLFLSQKSGPTTSESKCYSIQAEKCPPNTEFHFDEQRCS